MEILVTGGLGFIGSHTVVELIENGHTPIIVDNLYNASIDVLDSIEKITGVKPAFYEYDLLDKDKIEEIFKAHNISSVIHFAGYKAVGESVKKPLEYYQNNLTGSINLYQLMVKYHVSNLIFSSSATVYGSNFEVPFKEEYGYGETTNPYGSTKLMNEMIINDMIKANPDMSAVILRYFNPIGAHKSGLIGEIPNGIPNNLVPYIAEVATGKLKCLKVYGDDYNTHDGTGERDYIHVVDLAKAHVLSLNYVSSRKGVEVINVGTGKPYTVLDVVKAYEKASGIKIPYEITQRRAGDIDSSYADPSKAYELLGFKAEYGIEEMCKDSYNFMINKK